MGVSNAYAALTILEERAADFEIVISDERMLGLQGSEMLEHIGARWPHLKRVLLSAYTDGVMQGRGIFDDVIDKVHRPEVVAKRICDILNEPP